MQNKRRYIVLIILFLIGLILFLIDKPIPCIFNKITGLYCPGCGITRMFISILKLDYKGAFRYNPFVFVLLILYLIFLLINSILKRKIKITNIIFYIIIVLAIVFGILRNIPQLYWLRP